MAGEEVAVFGAAVAMEAAAAVAGRGKGTTMPNKGRTHQQKTVLVGTVARQSSRTSRIPCEEVANNPDEGAVFAQGPGRNGATCDEQRANST